jgi:tRNA(Ile)-lysidine synthase
MFFSGNIWRKASQQIIKQLNTLPDIQKSKVIVAFSGGQDSVFLLAALTELRKKYHYELYPVYIQHNLIPENNTYYKIALLSAGKIGWECVSFLIKPKPKRINSEDWMRSERYRLLEKHRKELGATYIAVAHHSDDQAETVLAHILRGCGIKGLSGMAFRWEKVIRPLLKLAKSDIEILMCDNNLPYYNDKTNYYLDYQRNKIRHELLPYLKKNFNPQISGSLTKLADAARENLFR